MYLVSSLGTMPIPSCRRRRDRGCTRGAACHSHCDHGSCTLVATENCSPQERCRWLITTFPLPKVARHGLSYLIRRHFLPPSSRCRLCLATPTSRHSPCRTLQCVPNSLTKTTHFLSLYPTTYTSGIDPCQKYPLTTISCPHTSLQPFLTADLHLRIVAHSSSSLRLSYSYTKCSSSQGFYDSQYYYSIVFVFDFV